MKVSLLTQEIIDNSSGLLAVLPEPSDSHYSMFNTGSVEIETAEFLYAWVKLTKPKVILETGTHYGISALYMGLACEEGTVFTLEQDKGLLDQAKKLWNSEGITNEIVGLNVSSLGYNHSDLIDLLFLDTEPDIRFAEAIKFYPSLKPGGYMFIHDLHRHMSQEPNEEHGFGWPFGTIPTDLYNLLHEGKLRPFHFATPRGLTGFYRPHERDFNYA